MIVISNAPAMSAVTTDVSQLHRSDNTCIRWDRGHPEWGTALAPRSFADERTAFLSLLPSLGSRYAGQYVAIANGDIVVHGPSRHEVTRRFFSTRKGPVYIGFVGPKRVARQTSPFRSRSNAGLS
jgi:hypothetical protein